MEQVRKNFIKNIPTRVMFSVKKKRENDDEKPSSKHLLV
jgi:hypothetical protein